ncbi:MAG: hypothetical protein AAF688_15720 [Bacteroidota bacterium]
MFKFFRHIRQRLFFQGKTGRYFKYAIGEIILVVIGIFIAETLAPTLKGGVSQIVKQ